MASMRIPLGVFLSIVCAFLLFATRLEAQATKPNIVVIFGDDIGYWNGRTDP